ncbi:hypothetical protein [Gelria sp. Kuro-4]|uniref:hypothetical protein n=1 Tax=Gelria sp. Kuro-4 TaxID=2796927 RepID=UPI001C81AA2A|nr:hypothetical protein [Gelria sp. Kuro-4]
MLRAVTHTLRAFSRAPSPPAGLRYVGRPLAARGLHAVLHRLQATRVAGVFSTQATALTTPPPKLRPIHSYNRCCRGVD